MVKYFGPTVALSSVGWSPSGIPRPHGGKDMRTVDDYAKYRTAHRDGLTIRQIARSFHVSRRKVREALAHPEPRPYTRTKPPPAPIPHHRNPQEVPKTANCSHSNLK